MRKTVRIALAVEAVVMIVALSLLLVPQAEPSPEPSDGAVEKLLAYDSGEHGFSIDYPQSWEVKEDFAAAAASFTVPLEEPSDQFQESVSVVVQQQPMQLEEYTEFRIDYLKQSIPDLVVVESESATLSGMQGHRLVYTSEAGSRKRLALWAIKDDREYVVIYAAEAAKYDRFLAAVQKMIDSFKIEGVAD